MNPHTDRPTPSDDPAHREAQEALPWLANGRLAGAELERLRAHLRACAQCRTDLALLHTIRAAGTLAEPDCDPERALKMLLPRLAPQEPVEAPPAVSRVAPRWLARIAANDRSWMRAAIALQCCAIVVLAVLVTGHDSGADVQAGAYRALGASPAVSARLVVMFRPDTPERELRRIVRANGARIVGGPTVTDAYLLDLDGEPAAVLARLRAEAAVTLAEPLATQGQP